MPHPLTIPTLSLLALAGSGLGIFLGREAVGEINPVYFSEAPTRFHTDLGPQPYSTPAAAMAAAGDLSPAELDQALGRGCVGCRSYSAGYYPVHTTSEDGYQRGWATLDEAPVVQASVQTEQVSEAELAERAAQEAAHAAALVAVHRYSSYPVTEVATEVVDVAKAEPTQLASAERAVQE